jgi:hypothetical protein
MMQKHQWRRPSHATVVAYLALFVALATGSAWAAATIGSNDIKNNAILTRHIKNGAVTTSKLATGAVRTAKLATGAVRTARLANGAVTGNKVGADTLTGTNIDESTLGEVPSANTANIASTAGSANSATSAIDATNVDGLQVRGFQYREAAGTGTKSFLSLGGLVLGAACSAGGGITVIAGSSADNSYVRSDNGQVDKDFDPGADLPVGSATANTGGANFVAYRKGSSLNGSTTFDGPSVTATFAYEAAASGCYLTGTATGRP